MYLNILHRLQRLQTATALLLSDKSHVIVISKEKSLTDQRNRSFHHKPPATSRYSVPWWGKSPRCTSSSKKCLFSKKLQDVFLYIYRFTVTHKHTVTTEDDWSSLTVVKASSEEHFSRRGQGRGRTRLRDLTRRLWSGLQWRWRDAAEEVINELMRARVDQRRELECQRQLWTSGR